MKIIEKINEPKDVKSLSVKEKETLAEEIRQLIIKKVNTTGGHMGPNLGIVEATIAMHQVFDFPKDKLIFDVSHQCYPHKILTGRKDGFLDEKNYQKYSGFTNPNESKYDELIIGHTSTSVSLATGYAKARDLQGKNQRVVALIGDGSLSGGEALEGLDNAADLNSNIIIIVNDNEMSIAVNYGGLYKNLATLRETKGKAECNFFKSLGFDYYYVENGNNIEDLVETFEKVKDLNHPVIVHIHTLKGKGLKVAEENKEAFHWILAGTLDNKALEMPIPNYNTITMDYFMEKHKTNPEIMIVNAGTPGAFGFDDNFRNTMGKSYVDVGIAEQHGVGFVSGAAKNGAKPVFAVLSSFVQRTYDQLSQDLALNNSPATILVYWGALSGGDATHLGNFDIPLISNIPNIVYLAPTTKEEYLKMLDWSTNQTKHSVAIRVPFGNFVETGKEDQTDYSVLNKSEIAEQGSKIAIMGLGNFFYLGKKLKGELKKENINATLINPKFISGLDTEMLDSLKKDHEIIITLEDGCLSGGFGEKISSFYGNSKMKVLNYGATKEFTDRIDLNDLYQKYHLTPELIISDIKNIRG